MSALGTQQLRARRGRTGSGFGVPPLGGRVCVDARCSSDDLPAEAGTPNSGLRQRPRMSGRLFLACWSALIATWGTGPSFSDGMSSVRLLWISPFGMVS